MLPCCCPICKREYVQAPKICECGFEGIYYPVQNSDEQRHLESAELFAIYKYAKRVILGELEYRPAELFVNDLDEYTLIDGMSGDAGLALIDPAAVGIEGESVAGDGLLAFKTDTKALILNTHRANGLFLDESCVKVLILGEDMKSFRHGYFMPYSGLRYIYVHKDNPAFPLNDVTFQRHPTPASCGQEIQCHNSFLSFYLYTQNHFPLHQFGFSCASKA